MIRKGFLLIAVVLVTVPAVAQEKADQPKTVKVQKGPWKIEATLKGVFEAENATELSLHPEAWSQPFEVKSSLKHGEAVKKGDVVVTFDSEKIDREIEDLGMQINLTELTVELAERELPILEKLVPIELATAVTEAKSAEEDLKAFLDVERPLAEESARFSVKNGQQRLKYAQEELKQLQAMYRDKDLTEETEEMILQRQRFEVESGEFFLKTTQNSAKKSLEVELPRREQRMKEAAVKSKLDLEKARNAAPLNIAQKRLALKKAKQDLTKSVEKLGELEADRKLFEITAPTDGIVYYGQDVDGQWSGVAQQEKKLGTNGKVLADDVFITIVQPRPMWVRAKVEEKQLSKFTGKPTGEISPTGFPELALQAQVESLSAVPIAPGEYEAKLGIEQTEDAHMLMPGMTCEFAMSQTLADDVLTLPRSAIFRDGPGSPWFVYKPAKNDEAPQKVTVKLGQRNADLAEIVEGLNAGDEVLASKPD